MEVGFQTMSGLGEVLVDTNNIKMFLRHAGVASNSVTLPAIAPVVYFRPLGEPSYLTFANLSGGQLQLTFRNPCEYYVFDRPIEPSYLDTFDGAGVQIFTAAQRPMHIIGSVEIPAYYNAYRMAYRDGWTYGGLVSGKYAYNQSFIRQGYNIFPAAGGGWESYLMAEQLAPTANGFFASFPEFGVRFYGWAPFRQNTFYSFMPNVQVSIIDVAGIL